MLFWKGERIKLWDVTPVEEEDSLGLGPGPQRTGPVINWQGTRSIKLQDGSPVLEEENLGLEPGAAADGRRGRWASRK